MARPPVWNNLPADVIEAFGKVPDCELAERIGASATTVQRKRLELGIPAYSGPRRRRAEIPPEVEQILGKAPDRELAERAGVGVVAIRWRRKLMGIPGHVPEPRSDPDPEALRRRFEAGDTDGQLAEAFDIAPSEVRRVRSRHGLLRPRSVPGPRPPSESAVRHEQQVREQILTVLQASPVPLSASDIQFALVVARQPLSNRGIRKRLYQLAETGHVEQATLHRWILGPVFDR